MNIEPTTRNITLLSLLAVVCLVLYFLLTFGSF